MPDLLSLSTTVLAWPRVDAPPRGSSATTSILAVLTASRASPAAPSSAVGHRLRGSSPLIRPLVVLPRLQKRFGEDDIVRASPSACRSENPGRFATGTGSEVCVPSCNEQDEVEVAKGYTMSQFCDKMINVFLHEKPQTKDWRKLLIFREEWNKYKESFFRRCHLRADLDNDPAMKEKLVALSRKVKKLDDDIEMHMELLKEIQENPTDLNAIVARRRKDFSGNFFHHLNVLSETYTSVEDLDAMARLAAKCLSAVSTYDNVVAQLDTLDIAQSKFDEILNSPSLDVACDKIESLAKAKQLDSSLILIINRAWAAAKDSNTMKNEVKGIMYHIYKAANKSLKSMVPLEIQLLKHLLNITDPEERFSALAAAFSPGDEYASKVAGGLYTTPKELHKWIKMMLDAYQLNKEETDVLEARKMGDPMVIQRLLILKETIEEEYMKRYRDFGEQGSEEQK